jgi:hypothetical protein
MHNTHIAIRRERDEIHGEKEEMEEMEKTNEVGKLIEIS